MGQSVTRETPERTCLACRRQATKSELIRFVASPAGDITPDFEGKLPGRGAYTCLNADCVADAVRKKQFGRAFKRDIVPVSPDQLAKMVEFLLHDRIKGLLGLANKAGKLVSGGSLVSDAIRGKVKPGLVLIASDASPDIADKIVALAVAHGIPHQRVMTKEVIGDLLGKSPRSAVAVKQGGFVAQMTRLVERYRNFLGEVRQA